MQIKVYVITEISEGGEHIIATRLTNEAARAIAKLAPNRRVTKTFATKDVQLIATDQTYIDSNKKEQNDGINSFKRSGNQ